MNKYVRYSLYVVIMVICVIIIIVSVYEVTKPKGNVVVINGAEQNIIAAPDLQAIKDRFNNEFTNNFTKGTFDDSNIVKKDATKELVYMYYPTSPNGKTMEINTTGTNGNVVQIDASIPFLNIDTPEANAIEQEIDTNITNNLNSLANQGYSFNARVTYSAHINVYNILSLAIKMEYKLGDQAQRIIILTYNYDLVNQKRINIQDAIAMNGLNTDDVNKKIKEIINQEAADAAGISQPGYNVYTRDPSLSIYDVTTEDAKNNLLFCYGNTGTLYIIYAYGNSSSTNTFDVIEF